MKYKKNLKKAVAGLSAFLMGASTVVSAGAVSVMAADEAAVQGEIAVNPGIHYQTLEGWGTSLCWWGNVIGSWGEADWNGNQRPDREEIAELAFSPEYLNLNIVRYNVGGGDKEDTSIKRVEGLVPGWTEDMTGTKDGSGTFDPEKFYGKETEQMSDAGQLWMLEQANSYRLAYAKETGKENDIINKVFSNSPPYYMTKSGTSTGGNSWDLNNLKEECYDDFALYLARAIHWVDQDLEKKFGAGVTYAEPLNEPDTSYWQAGSTKQEGCIFNTGELQSEAYREMWNALHAQEFGQSLDDIRITGTDETALWNAINSFRRLDDDVKQKMETISAHTYSGNDTERKELNSLAKSYDKGLWMSEVTRGGGKHYEGCHDSMDAVNARAQSEGIMADLKYMQSSAWIAWLVADSEYECLQTDSNWGLLHAVFEKGGHPVPDYHTRLVNADGSRKEGVPGEGYWAVTKQFYTMMQYSKYLKAGYTMVDIEDSDMCAAISPDGKELVIVAQNFEGERKTSLDLSACSGEKTVELYRTSDTESCQKVGSGEVENDRMEVTLPQNSVSTYVIREKDGSLLCDPENYSETVAADVVKPEESWTSSENKFAYTGSWGESSEEFGGGKYTTEENGSVTFTFEGNQAVIYGTKAPEGAVIEVSVDGGEVQKVSTEAEKKTGDALLFATGELGDGIHTVSISKVPDQGEKLVELNYAEILHGNPIERIESVEPVPDLFTVSGVQPVFPETVNVITNTGSIMEKTVSWNLEETDFSEDVTVSGKLEGTTVQAFVRVKVVPENVQYFIDCNSPDSPEYDRVDAYADLINEVPDRKYEQQGWGYLGDYGQYNGNKEDNYDTGWYAKENQSIEYMIPLSAGSYRISMGFKEWWNQDRPMKISVTTGNDTWELGTANTWKNGNPWNEESYEFICEEESDVKITVAENGGPDPVLSYIRVQKVLNTAELKAVLAQAADLDRSQYETESLKNLDRLVKDVLPLLYQAGTTQEMLQNAAEKVEEELKMLTGEEGSSQEIQKTSLELAIRMAEQLEAEQKENQCYTTESWERVQTALDAARNAMADPDATQEEVDQSFLNLITACNLLENGVQKVGLKAAIEGAKAVLEEEEILALYTPESVEAVRTALAEAERVFAMENADQETINQAASKLMDAVTGLLAAESESRLEILIRKAEELLQNREQYTTSSIHELEQALEEAKETAGRADATEEKISRAYDQLAGAMAGLVRKAEKSELKNALEQAKAILEKKADYVEETVGGLEAAVEEAQRIYEKEDASQEEVGEAVKKLVGEILKARLLGDVDGNGTVDSADAVEILKDSAEYEVLTEEERKAADVNRDGASDSGDAARILSYTAERIDRF